MKRDLNRLCLPALLIAVGLCLWTDGRHSAYADRSSELHPWFVYDYEIDPVSEGTRGKIETYLQQFGRYGVVSINSGRLYVRKSPSQQGEVVAWMSNGSVCTVLDSVQGDGRTWYRIKSGNFTDVYAAADYIRTGQEAVDAAQNVIATQVKVTASIANLRSEPRISEGVNNCVGSASQGMLLTLKEQSASAGGWYCVLTESGDAYIHNSCVDFIYELEQAEAHRQLTVAEQRQLIVEEALKCVGNPYVWGGESLTHGTDCSGLVRILYREIVGIELIHYSTSQANYGREISVNELQPGDLIFYVTMGGTRISHVAIYIGNGRVVQAYSTEVGIIESDYDFLPPVKYVNLLD